MYANVRALSFRMTGFVAFLQPPKRSRRVFTDKSEF